MEVEFSIILTEKYKNDLKKKTASMENRHKFR